MQSSVCKGMDLSYKWFWGDLPRHKITTHWPSMGQRTFLFSVCIQRQHQESNKSQPVACSRIARSQPASKSVPDGCPAGLVTMSLPEQRTPKKKSATIQTSVCKGMDLSYKWFWGDLPRHKNTTHWPSMGQRTFLFSVCIQRQHQESNKSQPVACSRKWFWGDHSPV